MALYKNAQYVTSTTDVNFDKEHAPGTTVPYSAIYKCMGCGREIVSEENRIFPPQNHHQHTVAQGKIRWKMIVYAEHQSTTV